VINNFNLNKNLEIAIKASVEAGKKIVKIYNEDFSFKIKSDLSPITAADMAANEIIQSYLLKTNIPIISEENLIPDYPIRKEWRKFWLVDPLDGTKEFINKKGEFTVNISLIENQTPIIGVVYVPVTKELYFAEAGVGSFKFENIIDFSDIVLSERINLRTSNSPEIFTIVASRSHLNDQTLAFLEQKKVEKQKVEIKQFGSSLKICKVAERKANCYPRLGPTMEWDTAAAHAIALYSGKNIFQYNSSNPIIYNKESLINPFFIVE